MSSLFAQLQKPVSIAPLVFFRIYFALMLFMEAIGAIFIGFVESAYLADDFHFKFFWMEWLPVLPGNGMIVLYALMAVFALMMLLGYYYRFAALAFMFAFAYGFLMEKTHYINHHYLVILLSFVSFLTPAHRFLSLDVKRNPKIKQTRVAAWTVFIFPALMGVVYIYAAFAKISADWLQAMPLKIWLSSKSDFWFIGPILTHELTAYFFAYGGIFFDLLIVPFMLWPKSRKWAFFLAGTFHLMNLVVFHIGIFPFIAMALTAMFFPPKNFHFLFPARFQVELNQPLYRPIAIDKAFFRVALVFMLLQILVPLRPYFISSHTLWTEEGKRFSWMMMLRNKRGFNTFYVYKDGSSTPIEEMPSDRLSFKKARKIGGRPDMIWQYAQYLKGIYLEEGAEEVVIKVKAEASLNGRPMQLMIDPEVDLAATQWQWLKANPWILPLEN